MIGNYNYLRKTDVFVKIRVSTRLPGSSVL